MMKNQIPIWIKSLRLRTLLLSQSCVLVGTCLAISKGIFNPGVFVLTLLTSGLLQILTNLANDYGDAVSGVDSVSRAGPMGMVSRGLITPLSMKKAIIFISVMSVISGSILVSNSLETKREIALFLILGCFAIIAAITYSTGKNPYGHFALGDLSVFIFFGWVGVIGSFYLQAGYFTAALLLPATACGLLATAVLNINNIRDMHSDAKAGKKTLAGILGFTYSKVYHLFLVGVAALCLVIFVFVENSVINDWIFIFTVPILVMNCISVFQQDSPDGFDPLLAQTVIASFSTLVLFGIGISI